MNLIIAGILTIMGATFLYNRCPHGHSSSPISRANPLSTNKNPEPVNSNSNQNCKGNENTSDNPPRDVPCLRRDVKNHPEIQRQIDLIKDHTYFKILSKSPESRGCPIVTNSYGLPNIASLYFGASIESVKNTVSFVPPESKCGSSGCINLPESVIQPDILKPGNNWHFKGEEGTLVIKLAAPADITGFTVLHPTNAELPHGYFKSAPKTFEVHGLKDLDDKQPHKLGSFEYKKSGPSAQTFLAGNIECDNQFKFIEVKFKKNYGNPVYTAVYKFQVHGDFGKPWFDSQVPSEEKAK